MTLDQIKSAALALSAPQREALAEELLLSITEAEQSEIDTAWLIEVRERDSRFQRGETTAKPADQVIERLLNKAGR
jgi:hypothetical protein